MHYFFYHLGATTLNVVHYVYVTLKSAHNEGKMNALSGALHVRLVFTSPFHVQVFSVYDMKTLASTLHQVHYIVEISA